MKLSEIFEIKPGELIEGIEVRGTLSEHYSYLSKNGWKVGKNFFPYYENWPTPAFTAALTCVSDKNMKPIKKTVIETKTIDEITLPILLLNQTATMGIFREDSSIFPLKEDEMLGMSLGENIVSFMGSRDMYRSDGWQVTCYHKFLHNKQIFWLRMISDVMWSKSLTNQNIRENLFEVEMEIG